MSSTEREDFKRLYATLVDISDKGDTNSSMLTPIDSARETYYIDRQKKANSSHCIVEYDFTTPVEMKKYLMDIWDYQECLEMEKIIGAFLVSSFRSFTLDDIEEGIPVAVYNF